MESEKKNLNLRDIFILLIFLFHLIQIVPIILNAIT